MLWTLASHQPNNGSVRLTEHNVIEYRVNLLHDNGIISDPYLGMGRTYAFNIVESIEINNIYHNELSRPEPVFYQYSAAVSFVARVSKNGLSTEADHIVVDELLETLIASDHTEQYGNLNMDKTIVLNLADYRAKHLATQSSLNFPITSEIQIDFTIAGVSDKHIESESVRSVIIPVSEPHFRVRLAGRETQATVFTSPPRSRGSTLLVLAIFGVIATGAFLVGAFLVYRAMPHKSLYKRQVDKLLRGYGDMIVSTSTPINPASYRERVIVKDANEILKLATTLEEPIIFYEAATAACFYLAKSDILYAHFIDKSPDASDLTPANHIQTFGELNRVKESFKKPLG
jgi:hypothetical protein